EDLFKRLIEGRSGSSQTGPTSEPRMVNIRIRQQVVGADATNPGRIRFRGAVGYALSNRHEGDEADVEVGIRYVFVEDQKAGDSCVLEIVAPLGFEAVPDQPGQFEGRLTHEEIVFEVLSAPYEGDWTARFVATGDLKNVPTSPDASESDAP